MSYWTFSDVFEENGVVRTPFYGGYGLIAERVIPKPAFNAFALLHMLGETRLRSDADSALITKRRDGALVIALWNYAPPDGGGEHYTPPGVALAPRHFVLELHGLRAAARARLWRVDRSHGNVLHTYDAMGRPPYPTVAQIAALRAAAGLAPPQPLQIEAGVLALEVPAQGLALIELR
jgi:xylan 1,4-beta-xylosidase